MESRLKKGIYLLLLQISMIVFTLCPSVLYYGNPVSYTHLIVKFADREYYVFIDVYKQVHWQQGMSIASIILSFFVLLTVLLVYHNHVVKRIMALAADVGKMCIRDRLSLY